MLQKRSEKKKIDDTYENNAYGQQILKVGQKETYF